MNVPFYSENTHSRSAHMSSIRQPSVTTRTSYIHLCPHVNKKPNLFGATQRKHSHPYHKFQTGSTTTFSGYTNITGTFTKPNHQIHNVQPKSQLHSNNTNDIRPLMSINCFQEPPIKNRRTLQHAEKYRNQASPMIECYANDNFRTSSTLNQLNGIILSDSMCKYVCPDKVSSHGIKVNISFESGCDCNRMLDFLEKQQQMINNDIKKNDFFVFSLCTNDVANVGVDIAIERCRFLIQRTRQLFPQIKTIGWLALSPRTKPSRLYSSLDINQCYKKFNQLLYNLSNEMNFKMINANLQEPHMHQDGLHPSIESGRIIIERTLHSWFAQQKNLFPSISTLDNHSNIPFVTAKTTQHHNQTFKSTHIQRQEIYTNNHQPDMKMHHKQQHNNNNHNINNVNQQYYNRRNNNKTNHQHQINIKNNYTKNNQHQRNINNNNNNRKNNYYDHSNIIKKNHRQHSNINDNNNNDENNFQYPSKKNTNNIQSNTLIDHYPHFLRHKQEFYRKIEISKELENKKEDIFHLTNMHFKTEYLRLEAAKWKTYVIAASNKRQSKERKDHMKTIIEINESLPIARSSPTGLSGQPAPLDLSEFAELFDEWLPEPIPGQKRKLGHRRDNPPTPPSPRQQLPPIIPRKTLPPRNPNAPLIGGSLRASPISNEITKDQKQQHFFHVLFSIEKPKQTEQQQQQHIRTPNIIVPPETEQSMTISPLQSSTPEPMIRSPSISF
ncbi:unnamed protein product [Rotaria sp. Silwood2]|nr:unnamed protein product [Rotaria sp. Silwood2]CAF4468416.1 unnamed protein product [Rotaria sp. Silwood2]